VRQLGVFSRPLPSRARFHRLPGVQNVCVQGVGCTNAPVPLQLLRTPPAVRELWAQPQDRDHCSPVPISGLAEAGHWDRRPCPQPMESAKRHITHRATERPHITTAVRARAIARIGTSGVAIVSRRHSSRPAPIARSGLAALAPEPHRTTRQPASNRSTEPAFRASTPTSPFVPIWRAWQRPAVAFCARVRCAEVKRRSAVL
jgi:hypothetical protein